jgi:hypothetical protein
MNNNTAVPDNIRLIASVSRLIDLHQSRRETGVYVPTIPENAGYLLSIALVILDCLHDLELENGVGMVPIGTLNAMVKERISDVADDEIQYCIDTMAKGRELQYLSKNDNDTFDLARTWDSTPLLNVADGFMQLQLSENGRLLLRVSSLKDSWLYSDLDAEKLVKAIERGQFKDVPKFCREMTLDLATKNKKISNLLEQPSISELREMLINEGDAISASLNSAIDTIKNAIALIYDERTRLSFDSLPERDKPSFDLVNLFADLRYVLSNVESVSRNFIKFLGKAQDVKNQGAERIKFLQIADDLALNPPNNVGKMLDAIFESILPFKADSEMFHPSMLMGEVNFRLDSPPENIATSFEIDHDKKSSQATFSQFLEKNKGIILERLKTGPMLFSEALELANLELAANESPIDFFGVYATPSLMDDDSSPRIIVGLNNNITNIKYGDSVLICSDPIMFVEDK